MKPIAANLQWGMRAPRQWGLLALGLSVVLLIGVIETVSKQRERGAELDEQSAQLRRAQQLRHEQAIEGKINPQMEALLEEESKALQPAQELLERGWRPSIGMLRLELSSASNEARLQLEAKSMQDIIAYVTWLEEQPGTARVYLVRSVNKDVPALGAVVEANLDLAWRPDVAPVSPAPQTADSASTQPVVSEATEPAVTTNASAPHTEHGNPVAHPAHAATTMSDHPVPEQHETQQPQPEAEQPERAHE